MRVGDEVLAQMMEVAFVIDGQGRYSYISPSIRHYGIEPAEMIGKPGIQFLHPADLGKVRGLLAFPDGRAIHCWSESADHRPVCLLAASFARVAFESADGQQLTEWREGP